MGTFSCSLKLENIDSARSLEVDALVGTGAFYTIVPAAKLTELGVIPFDRVRLRMADGRVNEYGLGQAVATVDGRSIPTIVVLGEDHAPPLLGAYTLEGLRLMVDPNNAALVPQTEFTA